MSEEMNNNEIALLNLIADIRAAVGDPNGKLMQDELIEWCRSMKENSKRLDYLIRHSCTQKADNGGDFWIPPIFPVVGKTFQEAIDNEILNENKE